MGKILINVEDFIDKYDFLDSVTYVNSSNTSILLKANKLGIYIYYENYYNNFYFLENTSLKKIKLLAENTIKKDFLQSNIVSI